MLADFYRAGRFGLSFEFYPPKTAAGEQALFGHLRHLMRHYPDFITCTYGAGGSTRDKTLDVVRQVKQEYGVPVAAHLTCVGATVSQLRGFLRQAQREEIDAIVALRGDPPGGLGSFQSIDGGLRYANELVELIHAEFPDFGVAVAGYPETHLEAASPDVDLQNLKRKVDAGAHAVITQLFYNNEDFFRFRDQCEHWKIDVPVIPGILPITNLAQIQRLTAMCGARMPEALVQALEAHDDLDWQFQVGVDYAIAQVDELIRFGSPGLHFYVLNKSQATTRVMQAVDLPRFPGF